MVKLKSATLLETLVATALILVIFLVSGLIINNLAKNTIQNNHQSIENELKRLSYFSKHGKINLPYVSDYDNWSIEVKKNDITGQIEIEAWQKNSSKTLNKTVYVLE